MHLWIEVPATAYLICGLALSLIPPVYRGSWDWDHYLPMEPTLTVAIGLFLFLWLFRAGRTLFQRPRRLLLLAWPTARSVWAIQRFEHAHAHQAASITALFATMGIICLLVCLVRETRFTIWLSSVVTAAAVFLAGLAGILEAGVLIGLGATWSHWPDPRPGQVHRQYPLRADEELVLGLPLMLLGAGLCLVAARLRPERRS
jgi:hypothetical protein